MNKEVLAPWARGPFELIRHANEHLEDAGDTDRRIALIGFDNAIEVCIDVFIKLHPRLRGGIILTKEDVEKATRNYHAKIEWLDNFIEVNELELQFSVEEIVWYHSLRNDLYHSGNGMVPEMHVLQGARNAALNVFKTLFKTDAASILGKELSNKSKTSDNVLFAAQNDEMELLRLFIEFERALETKLTTTVSSSGKPPRSISEKWEAYKSFKKTPSDWDTVIRKIILIRNSIAHGMSDKVNKAELVDSYLQLMKIIEAIKASNKHQKI